MAAHGVVFDGLIAEATTTDPSHMTMFTSLPASVHGVTRNFRTLTVPAVTLAETLRAHGYQTAAFTEDGPLAAQRGFAIGFDSYRENKSDDLIVPVGRVEDTFGQARQWLEQRGDRPFFLFLHTFQVHAPYRPPEVYRSLFDEREPASLSSSQRRTIANYDREIRYVDDELGKLVVWMEQRGLGDHNTIWVVLSDHGEEFWEHGSLGHLALPHEELLRVPLIARGPGIARGVRRSDMVHHLDLMPTLLELAGAPVPDDAQGRSFAPRLRPKEAGGGDPVPRALLSASWVLPDGYVPPAFAVRIGSEKMMRRTEPGGVVETWYDLAADPHERDPRKPVPARLRAAIEANENAATALRSQLRERAEAAARPAAPESAPLDPEREEMLRALGYIE
jgi:arylsulfatase A-like enzyme